MNVTAEVTIDIDEKRRVWSNSNAEISIEDFSDASKRAEAISSLSIAAANGALHAYQQVGGVAKQETFQQGKPDPVGFGQGKSR